MKSQTLHDHFTWFTCCTLLLKNTMSKLQYGEDHLRTCSKFSSQSVCWINASKNWGDSERKGLVQPGTSIVYKITWPVNVCETANNKIRGHKVSLSLPFHLLPVGLCFLALCPCEWFYFHVNTGCPNLVLTEKDNTYFASFFHIAVL